MYKTKTLSLLVALSLALFYSPLAAAQSDAPTSSMTAKLYEEIPEPGPIEVRPSLDLAMTQQLVALATGILESKGYTLTDKAGLIISFETDLAWSSGRVRGNGDAEMNISTDAQPDPQLKIPMPFARQQMPYKNSYSLRLTLYREGGAPLWIGKASVTDRAQGRFAASERMMSGLLSILGQTVLKDAVPLFKAAR